MFGKNQIIAIALVMASMVASDVTNALEIEEIVVTAERREASVQDTPIAVSAYGEQQMEVLQIDNAIDLVNVVPNLFGGNNTGLGTANMYYLRGQGTDMLVASGAVDLIVIDSVAALTPRAEIEGEMGDTHVGLQARLMSQALRKLTANIKKSNTMVIFINQIRMKIGVMFGSPETTTGGNALKFYSSVRLDIRRSHLACSCSYNNQFLRRYDINSLTSKSIQINNIAVIEWLRMETRCSALWVINPILLMLCTKPSEITIIWICFSWRLHVCNP